MGGGSLGPRPSTEVPTWEEEALLYATVLSLAHTVPLRTHSKIPYNDVTYLNYAGIVLKIIVSMP